jgi:hypothetical protein
MEDTTVAAGAARDEEEADKTVRAMHLEDLELAVDPGSAIARLIDRYAARCGDAAISEAIEDEFRAWWKANVHPLTAPSFHSVTTHIAWARHILSRGQA